MQYADWSDYRGLYLGEEIAEEDFPRLARRASGFLDYYTRGRAKALAGRRPLRMACCALAEEYRRLERAVAAASDAGGPAGEAGILREAVGGWSVTYRGAAEGVSAAEKAEAYAARTEARLGSLARQYLWGTGLLYRGGGR